VVVRVVGVVFWLPLSNRHGGVMHVGARAACWKWGVMHVGVRAACWKWGGLHVGTRVVRILSASCWTGSVSSASRLVFAEQLVAVKGLLHSQQMLNMVKCWCQQSHYVVLCWVRDSRTPSVLVQSCCTVAIRTAHPCMPEDALCSGVTGTSLLRSDVLPVTVMLRGICLVGSVH
jgi:hypothetical protein